MRGLLVLILVPTLVTAGSLTSYCTPRHQTYVEPQYYNTHELLEVDALAGELCRWLNPRDTEAWLVWGCDFLDHCEINAAFDPSSKQEWLAIRDDTMRRMQPWIYLREAQFRSWTDHNASVIDRFYKRRRKVALGVWYGPYDHTTEGRQRALKRLKDVLSVDDYREARLPCPVLLSAFTRVD